MATPLNMVRDINGFNSFGTAFSDLKKSTILVQNISQSFVVPSTGDSTYKNWLAVFCFQPGSSIWVALNDIAAIPSGAFSDTTSELNPSSRYVSFGDTLSFISTDALNEIGVVFYAVA
jgi:hypothetical protein